MLPLLLAALLGAMPLQTPPPPKPDEAAKAEKEAALDAPPVVTHHTVQVGGKSLRYTVTTGMMPLKSREGETEARIFFMAYTLDSATAAPQRPLMFSFNGGPGSSSVWLHLGALGPKRVKLLDNGGLPPPPYRLVENEYTWLDQTDLVFIDPVGTGYSRAAKPELSKQYWSVNGDIDSVGEFIRMYLTRYQRWASPLFLIGESYGGVRAAGLAGQLIDRGIAFNGLVLISPALNFQAIFFSRGNDLPYELYLPTYTATAWYHRKLPPDLQRDLNRALDESKQWALTGYADALAKGAALTPKERQEVIAKLARYTGLEPRYIDDSNLRINIDYFCKELLRTEKRTVGRYDSRIRGIDALAVDATTDHDPSYNGVLPPFTATFNDYVRTDLGYRTDAEYHILGGIGAWDWGSAPAGGVDMSAYLRDALSKNPYMKVFVAFGHYDLACPFYATQYVLNHLGLDPSLRVNLSGGEYEAGHMMYIDAASLAQLKADAARFIQSAVRTN